MRGGQPARGGGWLVAGCLPAGVVRFGCGGGRRGYSCLVSTCYRRSHQHGWLMADCLLLLVIADCQLLLFSSDTLYTIQYMNVLYLYLCYILLPRLMYT